MADDTYVQAIRYEADIADVQKKLNDLAGKQSETEGKTKDSTTKMSKHWDNVKDSVGKIAVGIGALGIGAVLAAPKILEGGASLEALDKKAGTVFEGSLPMVNTWAQANAKAMGLTTSQARDAAASVADLLKPMGFSAEAAAGMSTDMLNLSGALSAWSGGTKSAAEVSDIMTKAMLGETDGLKGLGISISAADVDARLAKNGTQDLTGAALEQAKAIAVQQLIMEKSGDAQKAWGDGSMDAVKKQNSMKASVAGVQESLTKALYPALSSILPIVTSVADWLGKNLPGAIATLKAWVTGAATWLGEHKEVLIAIASVVAGLLVAAFIAWAAAAIPAAAATLAAAAPVIALGLVIATLVEGIIYAYGHFDWFRTTLDAVRGFIVDKLVPAFKTIWGFITDNLIPIIKTLIEVWLFPLVTAFGVIKTAITDVAIPAFMAIYNTISTVATFVGTQIDLIVGFVTGIPGRVTATISTLWDGIKTGITEAKNWVSDRIDEVVGFATGLPGRMAGIFVGMWDGIKNTFRSVVNTVIGWWNGLEFKMPSQHVWGTNIDIGGFTIGVPDIPYLHSGGVVPGLRGQEVLAMVRGGETVRTEQQEASLSSGGGPVVNGNIIIQTSESAKHWYDESLWRVAG